MSPTGGHCDLHKENHSTKTQFLPKIQLIIACSNHIDLESFVNPEKENDLLDRKYYFINLLINIYLIFLDKSV